MPPYLQLIQQVRRALKLGLLFEGDQLPTVKEVVSRVAINPNTVSKAYRELEHEGLVVARAGVGTFVTKSLGDESLAALASTTSRPSRVDGVQPVEPASTTRASKLSCESAFGPPR